MRPIGHIPLVDRFQLENDQLAQVICQIRFSPVLRIRQDDAVIAFQEAIRQTYPRYGKQQGGHVLLTPAGLQQQTAEDAQHLFEDADGIFRVILAPDFIALETTRYSDIDDFAGRIARLAAAVQEHYGPAEIQRVGLRFINELRLTAADPKTEMMEAIEPTLLGAAGAPELADVVQGAQQVLELHGEDRRMRVRHGYQPGGTTVDPTSALAAGAPPVDLTQPFYLLDLDVFSERNVDYSQEAVETHVREFNDDIRSFFAWGVREDYRRGRLGQYEVQTA
ncbi:MAG: TIGR04255 family protein [Actinomycetota bacterium]|nr:TIGR04255 family protein [Actinomycetota bacterium]